MHITLRQLEVFAEVHKSGSTTQASQMLALSQSAVSAALTDLEGQLGVQLFDRVGKRLVVNEHGRLLYPRALALLERATEIEQLFRGDNGAIRVYASSTIGNYIMPEIMPAIVMTSGSAGRAERRQQPRRHQRRRRPAGGFRPD